ncbi:MAG: glycoside hydrolase family 30 beta sandwich domain-containing protein [bacterium]
MARDSIGLQYLTYDTSDSVGSVQITKQAVTVANGIVLTGAFDCKDNSLAIIIENTNAGAQTITVKAGEKQNACLGDSAVPINASSVITLRMRDIARYERKDGSLYLDFSTGFTGNIYAIAEKAGLGS